MAMLVLSSQSGMAIEQAKKFVDEQMIGKNKILIDLILAIYESFFNNTLHLMRELTVRKVHEGVLSLQAKRAQGILELPQALRDHG
jgi:hypothetical protein